MDPARIRTIIGHDLAARPARLAGFARHVPAGAYPFIVPEPGAHTDGLLLDGVDDAALEAFDAYEDEGRLYHRRRVEVVAGDERIACDVYVGIPDALVAEPR